MKRFMDEDFLLSTETAKKLYNDYAKDQPIIDYHCHLSPREIYEDKEFKSVTEIWLSGDHYKWRLMRANGIKEKYITGDGDDREKFKKWAETLELSIGNPLYHWSHLELKRYFGFDGILCAENADEVYDLCNKRIRETGMSPKSLIRSSNVEVICTTDDPADTLMWHKKIREEGFEVHVLPSFRPDKAINIENDGFTEYIDRLSEISALPIANFDDLKKALKKRIDFFDENGCRVSDHGLPAVIFEKCMENEADDIFKKRLSGDKITDLEKRKYQTAILVFLGREYHKKNWAMQLHFGVQRDLNKKIFKALGADAGIDAILNGASAYDLGRFLNALAETDELPKTIIYSLNPGDNAFIDSCIGCFQDGVQIGKVQHGAAWWFNDHKAGMLEQMTGLANMGVLGNFVGMLTDSRSFLSYTRHEYFRRILCDMIGDMVEKGEYPAEEKSLKKIVEGICYNNAKRYFGF
ncbi:MAG: glucuronate isomerase [Acetatifactor sp.]|nr:glucuronate isomerase [Acetatifactor sp.]